MEPFTILILLFKETPLHVRPTRHASNLRQHRAHHNSQRPFRVEFVVRPAPLARFTDVKGRPEREERTKVN